MSDAEEYKEKLRSIGQVRSGSKQVKRRSFVPDERDKTGQRVAGQHIEHWDGRQDAIAYPDTAVLKVGVKGEQDG